MGVLQILLGGLFSVKGGHYHFILERFFFSQDWPWQPHQDSESSPDLRDRITTGLDLLHNDLTNNDGLDLLDNDLTNNAFDFTNNDRTCDFIDDPTKDRNDTNFEKTEYNKRQKTQYLLQDKEDIVIRKTDKRKNCQRMITEYKTFKNRKDNRINSTLQRWIFPKKLLIFLCFVFLLPSTLSRCIT